ncbi:hypothetical protein [Clostridium botulinum]|uniref:hypothetical protein n=2 Tax=Clostridium botulinum TaxID=1491 RepID=UPI001E38D1FB|nr:hypothetical protein [Clostridium botulinum]MCD3276626.1 hypothetical protein [Clostridium botulinum C/D]MCD3288212.1 hypothetical protein [Clostridium botulinum C/D]MCD3291785.1 hypothetical protein [Clostridium botulinum C/D]MCD3301769.1 hypothetical protein [Clostridium botulinum C/D]
MDQKIDRYTNRHECFEKYISVETFNLLRMLYHLANMDLYRELLDSNKESLKQFRKKALNLNEEKDDFDIADTILKSCIYYERYCNLIEALKKEYQHLEDEEKKEIIDYYLFDNRLKELNCIGLSFYFDCKYKKTKTTLFRSEGGKNNGWDNSCCKEKKSEETLKYIFNKCREHINKGTDKIILRSYSKCLGLDLFKYVSITKGNNTVKLHIKETADINIIRYKKDNQSFTVSLQRFLASNISNCEEIDFCIDISNVRECNRDILASWMKKFLGGNAIQIQSFASPVSDKEVIMSYKPSISKFNPNVDKRDNNDCEISFELNKEQLVYLLYKYYEKYSREKKIYTFTSNFLEILKRISENENGQNYVDFVDTCVNKASDDTKEMIESIFRFVNWETENLNVDKNVDSVYKVENADGYINLFKTILQDSIR